MKNSIMFPAVIALAFTVSIFSCKNNEEKLKDAQKDVLQAQKKLIKAESESVRDYETFRMKVSKKVTDNELAIADLKIKAIDGTIRQKEQYNKQVAALEAKNTELKKTLDAYGTYNAETWEAFKQDINLRTAALEQDFKVINARKN
ncbi:MULTISPECIES: hypothetical protein [unclassified Flavobacterium]|uniref:hypothetical protein n=1 Tax=unclassified Flavobacterium TaxID=196869 RepID=UPI0025BD1DA0|nr:MULTISPECIES: hypothetical protein [unclassified Flavobacterium]